MNGEDERNRMPPDRLTQYRQAGFDEVPPPDVDRAILAEAERSAQRRARWRPAHLAWAAAVVLSVALVLEIGVRPPERASRLSEPVTEIDGGRREAPARAFRESAEPGGGSGASREGLDGTARDLDAPSVLRRRSPGPDAPPEALDMQAVPESASPAAEAPRRRCSEEIRGDAAAWLDCIAELRRAGEDAAADAELEALRLRYPAALERGRGAGR